LNIITGKRVWPQVLYNLDTTIPLVYVVQLCKSWYWFIRLQVALTRHLDRRTNMIVPIYPHLKYVCGEVHQASRAV